MKKSILIFCTVLTTLSLTAYGFKNWSKTGTDQEETSCNRSDIPEYDIPNPNEKQTEPDFFYDVDSRFASTITKDNLHNAKSIIDIIPKEATKGIKSFQNVKVAVLPEGEERIEMGDSDVLNPAQLNLLKSSEYSTNFYIRADYKRKNPDTGEIKDEYLVYYMTIVPEKEAEFKDGHLVLIDYLKENSKEETTSVKEDQLKPGKVHFIVTKNGELANVKLESTSGYTSVDKKMIELITNMPGKWDPATNSKGEKVDQELVFSFGLIGC